MSDLADKVRFLSDPAVYGSTAPVEARETHMSWVFLTETRVYKLKKPIVRPHLDFGTVERRRFFCEEEVRLNRRLAERTYLGVVPLRRRDGGFLLGGDGPVADWLVEMVRLPEAAMLDVRIARGTLVRADVEQVAERLAAFYAGIPGEPDGGQVYLRRLREELAIDGTVLTRPEFGLGDAAERPLEAALWALDGIAPLVGKRARRGRIVEGHGDLRPEHVCLVEPLQVIDCLEFDRSYRIADPYDEVRYLGLECSVLGADWVGPLLMDLVAERLGDRPAPELIAAKAVLRALTRARLCLAHLLEARVRQSEKWRPLALRYLAEAERACLSLPAL